MLRSGLIFLLLLHYLLVVGAGLVNRPETSRYSAAHPYVHSPECQQRNYLRLDCFDTCNGDQTAVLAHHGHETPQHLLSTLKSLDLHCLQEIGGVPPCPASRAAAQRRAAAVPGVPAGHAPAPYLPPRIG